MHVNNEEAKVLVSPVGLIGLSMWDTYSAICKTYANRQCLGTNQDGRWVWTSYEHFYQRVLHFSSGLSLLGLPGTVSAQPILAVWGRNQVEWLVADWACLKLSWVSLPLHPSLPVDSFRHILNTTRPNILLCDPSLLENILTQDPRILDDITLQLIFFSPPSFTPPLPYTLFEDIEKSSHEKTEPTTVSKKRKRVEREEEDSVDPIVTINFTSGSTGCPKGSVFTHTMMLQDFTLAAKEIEEVLEDDPDLASPVQMAIYNLAYVSPRDDFQNGILMGGRMGLFDRDMRYIFEDLTSLRPTIIRGVPALWTQLYGEFQKLNEESLQKAGVIIGKKKQEERKRKVLKAFRDLFGPQLRELSTGGAPLPPTIDNWLRDCFGDEIYVGEGYGTSETGLIAQNHEILPDVEIELLDVPELGYFSTDKPWPRGEVCVKTEGMIQQYYKESPEVMQSNFTPNGFFRTGDVAEIRKGKRVRELYLVDRIKNIVKLAQGEFICPVRLELIYHNDLPMVKHVFIHTEPEWRGVVAVVVPNQSDEKIDDENFKEDNFLELMHKTASEQKLRRHERVIAVYVERDNNLWTMQSGLLTASMKINRPQVKKYYLDTLRELYSNTMKREVRKYQDMLSSVGITEEGLEGDLPSSGIDSLTAVRLSEKLRNNFHVEISASDLLDSSGNGGLSQVLFEQLSVTNQEDDETQKLIKDLSKEFPVGFFETYVNLFNNSEESPVTDTDVTMDPHARRYLITGVTGFLGAFLLQELLELDEEVHCICLVRAKSIESAHDRIESHLKSLDLWQDSYRSRITVFLGDLSLEHFGVSVDELKAILCSLLPVKAVFHVGAQVDWLRSYSSLFPTNVEGTLRLLSLTRWLWENEKKEIPFYHVSTAGVRFSNDPVFDPSSQRFGRDPSKTAKEMRECELSGYLESKIVAEHYVKKAKASKEMIGKVSTHVFRPGMISGHSQSGAGNVNDFFSRYLKTAMYTHKYADVNVKFVMSPVDYVAKCVLRLELGKSSRGRTGVSVIEYPLSESLTFQEIGQSLCKAVVAVEEWKGMTSKDFLEFVREHPDTPVYPLWESLEAILESEEWDAATEKKRDRQNEDRPPVDSEYLFRCVKWLQSK